MLRILRTSAWVTLALCSDGVPLSSGEQEQCRTICDSIKADSSEACAKSRNSLPRPKIGRLCQEGFNEAFKLSCADLCSLHGTGRPVPSHLGKACDKRKREVPRPVSYKACVDGFNAGVAETTTLVTKRIASMGADARKALIDRNVSTLEDVDAERKVLDEAERAKQAEQAMRKNEELERAQRAVEEKSAEVKREKDALSKKQELEAAQAAEEAARKKKRAEEERQARIKATVGTREATPAAKPDGGDTASSLGSPIPTLEQLAEHGVDDRASVRRESPNQEILEGLQEGALAGEIGIAPPAVSEDKGNIESPNDAQYREVLRAEHVEGFRPEPDQNQGEVPSEPLDAVVSPAENASGADPEHKHTMELPDEPRYREVLTAEHVEGFGSPSARRGGGEPSNTTREGVTPSRENMPNPGSENGVIKLPDDPGYREVLAAGHVEGFGAQLSEQDGEPPNETSGASVAATENSSDDESENELSMELPDDAMSREVLTTQPLEGPGAPLGQEDGKTPRGTESEADEGVGLDTIELPNDDRYSDVFTPYRVDIDGDTLPVLEESQHAA